MDGAEAGGSWHCGASSWAAWQCIAMAVTDCAALCKGGWRRQSQHHRVALGLQCCPASGPLVVPSPSQQAPKNSSSSQQLFVPSSHTPPLPTTLVWHISRTFSISITLPKKEMSTKKSARHLCLRCSGPKIAQQAGGYIHYTPGAISGSKNQQGSEPTCGLMVITQPSASEQAGTVPEEHELLVTAPSALAHRTCKEETSS